MKYNAEKLTKFQSFLYLINVFGFAFQCLLQFPSVLGSTALYQYSRTVIEEKKGERKRKGVEWHIPLLWITINKWLTAISNYCVNKSHCSHTKYVQCMHSVQMWRNERNGQEKTNCRHKIESFTSFKKLSVKFHTRTHTHNVCHPRECGGFKARPCTTANTLRALTHACGRGTHCVCSVEMTMTMVDIWFHRCIVVQLWLFSNCSCFRLWMLYWLFVATTTNVAIHTHDFHRNHNALINVHTGAANRNAKLEKIVVIRLVKHKKITCSLSLLVCVLLGAFAVIWIVTHYHSIVQFIHLYWSNVPESIVINQTASWRLCRHSEYQRHTRTHSSQLFQYWLRFIDRIDRIIACPNVVFCVCHSFNLIFFCILFVHSCAYECHRWRYVALGFSLFVYFRHFMRCFASIFS